MRQRRSQLFSALMVVAVGIWALSGETGVAEADAHKGDDHGAPEVGKHIDHEGHGHGKPDGDTHDEHEDGLRLSLDQKLRYGIVMGVAGAGRLRIEVSLPGEIVFDEDRLVHLVPRVSGVARAVKKTVGDRVKAGEVMVVLESRELADAKSGYGASLARAGLAEKVFAREKALRAKKVSSEQDFLEAEQRLIEAGIELRSSEQKLHALGLSRKTVKGLAKESDDDLTRFEIRSPIDGVVTKKHVATGESLAFDAEIFTIVDTRSVWVNLAVYTKNLSAVKAGSDVVLKIDHSGVEASGKVSMVTPFVDEATRSATARVVLSNQTGEWLPGTFVTGYIGVSTDKATVVVPLDAVQHLKGKDVVFVENKGLFSEKTVVLGRRDRTHVEIVAGLKAGAAYVVEGAFQLKTTVVTSSLGGHAGHGH